MNESTSFEEFLRELNENTRGVRKATFMFEDEMLKYLNIDLDFFDNMTIIEIRDSLIGKRDKSVA